jgi:hypothetical protein
VFVGCRVLCLLFVVMYCVGSWLYCTVLLVGFSVLFFCDAGVDVLGLEASRKFGWAQIRELGC